MNRSIRNTGRLDPSHASQDELILECTRSTTRYKWKSGSRLSAFTHRIFRRIIQAEAKRFDTQNQDGISKKIPFY